MHLTMFRVTKIETEIDRDDINQGGMPALRIRFEDDTGEKMHVKLYLAEGMEFLPHKTGDLVASWETVTDE